MFDRFTDRAKRVMNTARNEAQRLKHHRIDTEHILLGLTEERTGVAASVLRGMGIDPSAIRTSVEERVEPGPSMFTVVPDGFSASGKRVIELAMKQSESLGHAHCGTEHVLLGLIQEKEGIAAGVLIDVGLKLEDVREEILDFLDARDG